MPVKPEDVRAKVNVDALYQRIDNALNSNNSLVALHTTGVRLNVTEIEALSVGEVVQTYTKLGWDVTYRKREYDQKDEEDPAHLIFKFK